MAQDNPLQYSPRVAFPEVVSNVYEKVIAPDRPRQEGPRQASELVSDRGELLASFTGGVATELLAAPSYERRQAGQVVRDREYGDPQPSWTHVDERLAAFASGAEQAGPTAPQTAMRLGSRPTLAPAPSVPERQNYHYLTVPATGRSQVANEAEVSGR